MDKQLEVQRYLHTVESATLDEIYANVTFTYWHNHKKHLGTILSRMVKNGKAKRLRQDLFAKSDAHKTMSVGKINTDEKLPSLFDQ